MIVYSYQKHFIPIQASVWPDLTTFLSLLGIRQNSEPTLANVYAIGQIFIAVNGQISNNNLASWPHWLASSIDLSTRTRFPIFRFQASSRCSPTWRTWPSTWATTRSRRCRSTCSTTTRHTGRERELKYSKVGSTFLGHAIHSSFPEYNCSKISCVYFNNERWRWRVLQLSIPFFVNAC